MNQKPVVGTYTDKTEIENIFKDNISYHSKMFDEKVGEFSADPLFEDWRLLNRCVDEFINVPFELSGSADPYLNLEFKMLTAKGKEDFKKVGQLLENDFGPEVASRFNNLALMCMASHFGYQSQNLWQAVGYGLGLSSVSQSINYLQSRRLVFGCMLNLIPIKAIGQKKAPFLDLMNQFLYTIDSCLNGYTNAYYHLLINECITGYEVTFDGNLFKANFTYDNLEAFFLEPERLSLLDQMELRPDVVLLAKTIPRPKNVIFSFNEVANAMALFEGAFKKYSVTGLLEYQELNLLFVHISRFCTDNYHVIVDESDLDGIQLQLKKLKLTPLGNSFTDLINDYAPFQKFQGKYYCTVVLLCRFVYRTLTGALMRNKSFMINSGFVFEDKVEKILINAGYHSTGITRINHKEFDLITTKNGKIYNFQCKNNHIDIAKVGTDYKLMGRLNKRLITYYRKSITKEVNRENLIKTKLGLSGIEHFVISRFPVITQDADILNFNSLESWLGKQNH
ncbi:MULTISPECIES: hypothetical protein [unclassified Pedobacter]|uniref:hypothetical protein n=1 Tax=unclassified Pedobacter TaxID=2628915 RepID=UPI001D5BFE8A|nr:MULTISPECIES: hypothetical protein [unclassified Pedobacter]CAH0265828.1 hypothetical protein SRABI36_03594 [Pedobacter sp. Bi36]CAH0292186.1 hypothetical protein SRABI126_04088 [Pedobacter sp. Bi126]